MPFSRFASGLRAKDVRLTGNGWNVDVYVCEPVADMAKSTTIRSCSNCLWRFVMGHASGTE